MATPPLDLHDPDHNSCQINAIVETVTVQLVLRQSLGNALGMLAGQRLASSQDGIIAPRPRRSVSHAKLTTRSDRTEIESDAVLAAGGASAQTVDENARADL